MTNSADHARGFLALLFLAALMMAGVACGPSVQDANPAEVRHTYTTLPELVAALQEDAASLREILEGSGTLRTHDFNVARTYAINLQVYAQDLRGFRPEGRSVEQVAQFDHYASALTDSADLCAYNCRLHKQIVALQEVDTVDFYVGQIARYLDPPRPHETGNYEERIEPFATTAN